MPVEDIGYDFQPETGGGIYLRLRKKGDKVRMRLVSTPVHYQSEYEGKTREQFAWLVIDRSDNQVKVYNSSVSVYLVIKGLVESEDWGDPTHYDISIERTEESTANYYKVIPSPKHSPLTEEELKLVEESHLDLKKLVGKGKGTKTFGEVKQGRELTPEVEEEQVEPSDIPF